MAPPPRALPEGVEDTVLAEIIGCISSDEAFSKSGSFWEQCADACQILLTVHTPSVPFAPIVQSFSVDKNTIRKRWQNFKSSENILRTRGRPIVLTTEEVNEIVDVSLNSQVSRKPLSGPEVPGIIEKEHHKTVLLDLLCQNPGELNASASSPQYRRKIPGCRSLNKQCEIISPRPLKQCPGPRPISSST
jgi:hypothetical protein